MRCLIISLICAIVNVSSLEQWTQEIQDKQDKLLPKVVSIKYKGIRTGTGSLVNNLTVLSANKCINDAGIDIKDVTIHFPNDSKPYKVQDTITDGDIVIIMLDKSENPPKCEFKVQLEKPGSFKIVGRLKVLRCNENKDEVKLEYFSLISEENCFFRLENNNMTDKGCGFMSSKDKRPFSPVDLGLPLFYDGLLEGVLLVVQSEENPIIFEKSDNHRLFLEKYLNNPAEPKNPEKERNKQEVEANKEKKEANKEKEKNNEEAELAEEETNDR